MRSLKASLKMFTGDQVVIPRSVFNMIDETRRGVGISVNASMFIKKEESPLMTHCPAVNQKRRHSNFNARKYATKQQYGVSLGWIFD